MFIKAISRCNYISNKFKVSHNTRCWSHLLAGGINDLTVQWSVWILSLTCSMWWWLLWSSHSSQCVHFLRLLLMVSGNSTMFSYDHRRSNVYYHYRNVVFCTTMSLDKKILSFLTKKGHCPSTKEVSNTRGFGLVRLLVSMYWGSVITNV